MCEHGMDSCNEEEHPGCEPAPCSDPPFLLFDLLDWQQGTLDDAGQRRLAEHVAQCGACQYLTDPARRDDDDMHVEDDDLQSRDPDEDNADDDYEDGHDEDAPS